jgi:hypothetical protein
MNPKTIDRLVVLVYVVLVIAAAIAAPVAVGPIAIGGAVVVAGWFSFMRPLLRARERAREQDGRDTEGPWF